MADARLDAVRTCLPILDKLQAGEPLTLGTSEQHALGLLITWLTELSASQPLATVVHEENMDAQSRYMLDGFMEHFSQPIRETRRGHVLCAPLSSAWLDTMLRLRVKRIAEKWRAHTLAVKRTRGVQETLGAELAKVLDWSGYNAVRVAELSGGRPLEVTANAVLGKLGVVERLHLPRQKLSAFLGAIEVRYKDNPYHNNTHAADVVQAVACVIATDDLIPKLTDLEALALVLAAVVHDVGHPGVNNAYLVRALKSEALTYNDIAVNENGHLASAFDILKEEPFNFLDVLPDEDWRFVRHLVIDLVLATDMACHTKDLAAFQSAVALLGRDFDAWTGEHRTLALKFLLHSCDISNPARPWDVCREWAARITRENFAQGDRERAEGLPVSPVCDREKANPLKGQLVFATHFVRPTFEALSLLAPALGSVGLAHVEANAARYEKLLATGATQVPDMHMHQATS